MMPLTHPEPLTRALLAGIVASRAPCPGHGQTSNGTDGRARGIASLTATLPHDRPDPGTSRASLVRDV
jgi:hypothetical protein